MFITYRKNIQNTKLRKIEDLRSVILLDIIYGLYIRNELRKKRPILLRAIVVICRSSNNIAICVVFLTFECYIEIGMVCATMREDKAH